MHKCNEDPPFVKRRASATSSPHAHLYHTCIISNPPRFTPNITSFNFPLIYIYKTEKLQTVAEIIHVRTNRDTQFIYGSERCDAVADGGERGSDTAGKGDVDGAAHGGQGGADDAVSEASEADKPTRLLIRPLQPQHVSTG